VIRMNMHNRQTDGNEATVTDDERQKSATNRDNLQNTT
jgi:hypothetical protein